MVPDMVVIKLGRYAGTNRQVQAALIKTPVTCHASLGLRLPLGSSSLYVVA